jgi:ferrous iron transport protein B
VGTAELKILLLGNPNVGKSVIFSNLTGINVVAANYPGTTVSYSRGHLEIEGRKVELIDVPGTYVLDADSQAEQIAGGFLDAGADALVCVLDASNLERNLYLALQVIERGLPVVVALNLIDVARDKKITINREALEEELGVPVVVTAAITGQGLPELRTQLARLLDGKQPPAEATFGPDYWKSAERITQRVQKKDVKPVTLVDRLEVWMVRPFPGVFIALLAAMLAFTIVVGGGMGFRQMVLQPIFHGYVEPAIRAVVESLVAPGLLQNVLIGEYGFAIKSIEWPLTLVFPYVLSFYLMLALLEDSGYMSRLATLLDVLFRKIGLQGSAVVPFLLGYGCAIPAIMSTRTLADRRQRVIVSSLVALGVPCISQSGAFISLLAERSVFAVLALYLVSFIVISFTGFLLTRLAVVSPQPLLMELPPLLRPNLRAMSKRTLMRLRHFAQDALLPLTVAVAVAALLFETGGLRYIGEVLRPLVVVWLGLPAEASVTLIMGIVRRELAVLPLIDMDLTAIQLFVGAVVALLYMPCIAVFAVLAAEFKLRVAVAVGVVTVLLAFLIGGLFNHGLHFLVGLVG